MTRDELESRILVHLQDMRWSEWDEWHTLACIMQQVDDFTNGVVITPGMTEGDAIVLKSRWGR